MPRREGDVAAALRCGVGVGAVLQQNWATWGLCGSGVKAALGAAWGLRERGESAGCCCVGAAWGRRGGDVGPVA